MHRFFLKGLLKGILEGSQTGALSIPFSFNGSFYGIECRVLSYKGSVRVEGLPFLNFSV